MPKDFDSIEIQSLDIVASKIRPLPAEIAPSLEFVNRTRLYLLRLDVSLDQDRAA
jgi:hypothetical protein